MRSQSIELSIKTIYLGGGTPTALSPKNLEVLLAGINKKVKAKFEELKKTLVITSGDNYVGAAKKQLREKMADLYSKVASSYDRPSSNEIDNLRLIEKEMKSGKDKYEKLLKKVDLSYLSLKSYEDFVAE